jgi:hypothetical protein
VSYSGQVIWERLKRGGGGSPNFGLLAKPLQNQKKKEYNYFENGFKHLTAQVGTLKDWEIQSVLIVFVLCCADVRRYKWLFLGLANI